MGEGMEATANRRPRVPARAIRGAWAGYNEQVPAPTDGLDLDAIRRELEARRQSTHERVALLAKRPERGTAQGFGKRIGDGTTEAVSRLTEVGVFETLTDTESRVARALEKIEDGTYGGCDSCEKPIAPGRLRVAPQSTLCVDCARLS